MEIKTDDLVNVAIRIRPSRNILAEPKGIELINENPSVLYVLDRQQPYTFDNVFSRDATQEEVFDKIVRPLTKRMLLGYNCTIFAYGQTGTGKTYTVGCNPDCYEDAGFITRTLDELFDSEEYGFESLAVSFYEIYKEKVYDLLGKHKIALPVKGFKVHGLTEQIVSSAKEARSLLKLGSSLRHTGGTKQNLNSSRSHAIFTIHCIVQHSNGKTAAKLNLVDLAGSENVRKTQNEGAQFLEGVHINKGLFNIGRVMNALSTNMPHIPYRQSMITTILRDSLHKTNFVTLVACISPDVQDALETTQTLEFAQSTKKIKNCPEINHIVQQYKNDNPTLFEKQPLGSAVKARPTPLKRFRSLQYAESETKRTKIDNTWTPLRESHEESSFAIGSNQLSQILSTSKTFDLLSPLARKCTEALETKMMDRLEVLMKSHLITRNASSAKKMPLSGQTPMAASSPIIKDQDYLVSETTLIDESALGSDNIKVKKKLEFDESVILFKVPKALPRKNIKKNNRIDVTLLPLEESMLEPKEAVAKPRRSVRLSLKRTSILPPPTTFSPSKKRQSARLSIMKKNLTIVPTPMPRLKVPKSRKSFSKNNFNCSPGNDYAKHVSSILDVLNNANKAGLQKLPFVGPKTATQIYLHRQLNGKFESIKDLQKMECWPSSTYQRFIKANLLKNDN